MDHVKYLKTVIETLIVGRDGATHPLSGRFLEVYPKPSEILELCPCAILAHRPGKMKENGSLTDRTVGVNDITITHTLYDVEQTFQIDFYSTDIYDFLERDQTYTGFLQQFINLVAKNYKFSAASDGRTITVSCGACGIVDAGIVVDGIYKAFCQVTFKDGVYSDTTVPKITGVIINEGGIS